jgi:arylsulfatase A-like enzyme
MHEMIDLRGLSYKAIRLGNRLAANLTARTYTAMHGGIVNSCRHAAQGRNGLNVLIVTLDSLRADRVGYLSGENSLTPNLNKLAKESICFTKAIAQASWTKPSVSSFLTGLYPSVHGANIRGAFGAKVTNNADPEQANEIRSGVATLSELLAQANYTTAAFTGGGFAHAIYQGRGFQHFCSNGVGLRDLFLQCASWFTSGPSRFFVWLHAYDTHRPYRGRFAAARFVRRRPFNLANADVKAINSRQLILSPDQIRRLTYLYDEGVRHADRQIGFLVRALRSSGLLDHTILIFTSDHGEALYEHKLVEHWDVIYNEVIQVPLLIRIPGAQPRTVSQYASLIDLMPTIMELLNLPIPEVQGTSLVPAMFEGKDLDLTPLSESEMNARPRALQGSLNGRDYKIIRWLDTERTAFFDLTADPGEQNDLWQQHNCPAKEQFLSKLNAQLENNTWWATQFENTSTAPEKTQAVTWEVEQRLKDLGYIE